MHFELVCSRGSVTSTRMSMTALTKSLSCPLAIYPIVVSLSRRQPMHLAWPLWKLKSVTAKAFVQHGMALRSIIKACLFPPVYNPCSECACYAEQDQSAQQAEQSGVPHERSDQLQQSTSKDKHEEEHRAARAEAGPDVHVDKEAGIISIANLPPGSR